MNEVILETTNLSKTFSNNGQQQHVLKNLNLNIYQNDFTIIMGPSGGGKSTLLYALSGMDIPTLGQVVHKGSSAGQDIAKFSQDQLSVFRRKHCGFVFQQIYLIDTMSVLDNILLSGLLVSKHKKQVLEKAKKLLTAVGLDEQTWGKFPNQLSGGEAQRAGMVRAVINSPHILFADEPTGALNSQNAKRVLNVMTQVNEAGQSIVMVTHDLISALRGNRILYLRDGVIEGECSLSKYEEADDSRKLKLKAFLAEMGW